MKRTSILILFFWVMVADAAELKSRQKKVLFIGNSLTSHHNMPITLQKMIDYSNLNIKIEQLTFDGARLSVFASYIEYEKDNLRRVKGNETPIGVKKIMDRKWDYVVLQEGGNSSLVPCFQLYSFEPSLIFLDSVIKSIHAKTVICQDYAANTFPYRGSMDRIGLEHYQFSINSDHQLNPLISCNSNVFNNSSDQFYAIKKIYDDISKKTNSSMVKVGYAFEEFKKKKQPFHYMRKMEGIHQKKDPI